MPAICLDPTGPPRPKLRAIIDRYAAIQTVRGRARRHLSRDSAAKYGPLSDPPSSAHGGRRGRSYARTPRQVARPSSITTEMPRASDCRRILACYPRRSIRQREGSRDTGSRTHLPQVLPPCRNLSLPEMPNPDRATGWWITQSCGRCGPSVKRGEIDLHRARRAGPSPMIRSSWKSLHRLIERIPSTAGLRAVDLAIEEDIAVPEIGQECAEIPALAMTGPEA